MNRPSVLSRLFLSGIIAIACLVTPAFGAVDFYLKIDGIDGESDAVQGAIKVEAVSYNVKSPRDASSGLATGRRQYQPLIIRSDGGTGKVSYSDLSFTKSVTRSSPVLLKACATGVSIPQAVLSCRKSGGDEFLKVTLSDCFISSYSTDGQTGDDTALDAFSIRCSSLDFKYTVPGATGESQIIELGWDLATGKK